MSKIKIISKKEPAERGKINPEILKVIIAAAPFLAGIYFEWASGLVCIFLLIYLWYCYKCTGEILVQTDVVLLAAVVIPAVYGLSIFWAVDSGMAIFGMIKYLPLPLFVLALKQTEQEKRKELLNYIPISGMI